MLKCLNNKSGFTLIEMIIYVALVGIISAVLFSVTFFVIRTNNKIIALSKVSSNAHSVMERMTYEMANSKYIYLPTSNFVNYNYDLSKGNQLSLATEIGVSSNENIAFIDFYVENDTLFLKEDGLDPIALTSSGVLVSKMEFSYYKNDLRESVTIDMTIHAKNSAISDSKTHLVNTAALRSF
ncbi:type II secretion system protein [Candidatus Parcubacteria bacterium]|nr:type II secretion system protein [Candidatus Parcubacteria bacterium]